MMISGFGFRISGFFRISDFGFRIWWFLRESRSDPIQTATGSAFASRISDFSSQGKHQQQQKRHKDIDQVGLNAAGLQRTHPAG
jgi:hypothetical protein